MVHNRLSIDITCGFKNVLELRLIQMHGLKILYIFCVFLSCYHLLLLSDLRGVHIVKLLCCERVLHCHTLKFTVSFQLHLILSDNYSFVSLSAGASFCYLSWQRTCRHHGLAVTLVQAHIKIRNWDNLSLVFIDTNVSILLVTGRDMA